MQTVRSIADLRAQIRRARENGKRIGFVPTMGALHQGHLSLLARAREDADFILASVFVNPAQFGPNEDFEAYPRDSESDLAKLRSAQADLAYLPTAAEMYPKGATTRISVGSLETRLCGRSRPGHFAGVATIVCKLLNQCKPDIAVFGEKDYQQLLVIRRMVRDLDMDALVIGAPIIREPDGLAMSSRNRYLSDGERQIAPALYGALSACAGQISAGAPIQGSLDEAIEKLKAAGFTPDYLELRDAGNLEAVTTACLTQGQEARLLAAAFLGPARLIDNLPVTRTAQ